MFLKAKPVFAAGKEKEMNSHLFLRETVGSLAETTLYITAFSFFRLWVNGSFVFFGPSRGPGGYARVEQIDLSAYHRETGNNELVIEVAGYYCGSLATVNRSSFVTAELRRGEAVLLCTGRDFEGYCSGLRVQKAERYSVQRHFGELWDYTVGDPFSAQYKVPLEVSAEIPQYLPSTPQPCFLPQTAENICSSGTFVEDTALPVRQNRYSWQTVPESWGIFPESEIVSFPHRWIQSQKMTPTAKNLTFPKALSAEEYALIDMHKIWTGFLELSVTALSDCEIVVGFSELCEGEVFSFTSMNAQNVIGYRFPAGMQQSVMSFEPYTCRFAVVMVKSGSIKLNGFGIRRYEYDTRRVLPREFRDPELKRIYDTAVRTFSHNVVDIYMDCPSRERAGWLCDSYFMGQVECFLTGETAVEDAFLENYRLHTGKGNLPKGILPECYPSDFEGNFIPQWNLWYILQVYEYLTDRKKSADKELFRPGIYGILTYFQNFENTDGLLQNLPSWNFVEWSKANTWVQDVNYPTNFLYAEALERTARLYGDESFAKKAEQIRSATREKSFSNGIFLDHAVMGEDGLLHNTANFSEAGQYYAALFGGVDLNASEYADLKKHIENSFADFDPNAANFVPVNMFIGYFLRLLVLMKLGWTDILKADVKTKFRDMIDLTDTLWEYNFHQRKGSYDHGFSSFAAVAAAVADR